MITYIVLVFFCVVIEVHCNNFTKVELGNNVTTQIMERSGREYKTHMDGKEIKRNDDFSESIDFYFPQSTALIQTRRKKPKRQNAAGLNFKDTERYDQYEDSLRKYEDERKSYYYDDATKEHNSDYRNNFGDADKADKIFNQQDINEFYMHGKHDYSKLVNDYLKNRVKSENANPVYGDRLYGDSESGKRYINQYLKSIADKEVDFNQYRIKEPEKKSEAYKTITSYDDKDAFGKSPSADYSVDSGKQFGGLRDSYGSYISNGDWTPTTTKTMKQGTGLYGQNFDYKKYYLGPNSGYSYIDQDSTSSTSKPFNPTESNFVLKNYASKFNFDEKQQPISTTSKYTFPDFTGGKQPIKNSEFVSEFDIKGNPISQLKASEHSNREKFTEKDATPSSDFVNTFYNLNKSPQFSYWSSFDSNVKKVPESSSVGPYINFGKSYASTYDYNPQLLNANFASTGNYDQYKNYDFNKLNLIPTFTGLQSSGAPSQVQVEGPHQIIIPVPQPYPVKVPIAKPVAVPIYKEIRVPIEKVVPYPVIKNVPYPVEKHVPVTVEKQVKVEVPQPYPVKIPVIKNVYHHSRDIEPRPHDADTEPWQHETRQQHEQRHQDWDDHEDQTFSKPYSSPSAWEADDTPSRHKPFTHSWKEEVKLPRPLLKPPSPPWEEEEHFSHPTPSSHTWEEDEDKPLRPPTSSPSWDEEETLPRPESSLRPWIEAVKHSRQKPSSHPWIEEDKPFRQKRPQHHRKRPRPHKKPNHHWQGDENENKIHHHKNKRPHDSWNEESTRHEKPFSIDHHNWEEFATGDKRPLDFWGEDRPLHEEQQSWGDEAPHRQRQPSGERRPPHREGARSPSRKKARRPKRGPRRERRKIHERRHS